MAAITINSTGVRPDAALYCVVRPYTLAEAVTAGAPLYLTTTGTVGLAAANTSGKHQFMGIALETRGAGEAIRVLISGWVYGYVLTSQAYGATIYASDTAGTLADAAGTNSVPVGYVDALNDDAKTKVLRVPPRGPAAFA